MGRICVTGGRALCGETTVQGSKNAALPLMAAAVLHKGMTVLHNCPRIRDVDCMCGLLEGLGCQIWRSGHTVSIDASSLSGSEPEAELSGRMRASVLLMGSLLGRCGEASLSLPGGCVIGSRPIDYHLALMRQMGAELQEEKERVTLRAARLTGQNLTLAFPSVGATENGILAAVRAEGTTVLRGCALEPEIRELCVFLRGKGAAIVDYGSTIGICGVSCLRDSEYTLMPDRIAAGTYLLAAAGTGGWITLHHAPMGQLASVSETLRRMGVRLSCSREEAGSCFSDVGETFLEETSGKGRFPAGEFCRVTADCRSRILHPLQIHTAPYPGFPTDLQSPLMAALTLGEGRESRLRETIFEARFQAAEEMRKLGAEIELRGELAVIHGVKNLHGAGMTARELRGGAALVIAGLMADGASVVEGSGFVERGYEDFCGHLRELGGMLWETD